MPPEISWLKQAADFAAAAGPYGVIAALLYVVRVLWSQNQNLLDEKDEIHRERVKEVGTQAERLATVATTSSGAIVASATALASTTGLVQDVFDVVRLQPTANEAMTRALERNGDKMDRLLEQQRARS